MFAKSATLASKTLSTRLLPGLAAALLAAQGHAQSIFVEEFSGGVWQTATGFATPGGGGLPTGSELTLDITRSSVIRIFTDNPTTTDIGRITVNAAPGVSATVLVAALAVPGIVESQPNGQPAARSIEGIVTSGDVTVQVHAGSISGVGIEARHVARVDLTGDLDGPVIHWGNSEQTQPGISGITVGGSVTEAGSIVAVNGQINDVDIAGDLLGDIAAQNGGFLRVNIGGNVGNETASPTIYGWSGNEAFGILTLLVDGDVGTRSNPARVFTAGPMIRMEAEAIHAEVNTTLDQTDPGYVGGIIARSGDLTGSVVIEEISGFGGWAEAPCVMSVAGNLSADVLITRLVRNERPSGPEIDIAGAVTADAVLSVGGLFNGRTDLPGAEIRIGAADGLEGQIIVADREFIEFDADDAVRLAGNGLVVTPEARFLPDLFSELGGGSVGIAPFNFHSFESFPQHNETLLLTPGTALSGAVIRLYGPAFGEAPEFVVEHRLADETLWVDRSNEFQAVVADLEADATREVRIEALTTSGFEPGEWRLRPVDDSIRCAFTVGVPSIGFESEYDDNTYRFIVGIDCNTGGRRNDLNDLRSQDEGTYVTPVTPPVDPCP